MLFTGDINSGVCKRLVRKYGKQLAATYMQAPHHGNNKGRKAFFKAVNPQKAFFDAPAFLCERTEVRNNRKLLKKQGCKVVAYGSGKNTVTLR